MGLLDSLLYNTDNYGGQGGGLLDFLRTAQMQNSNYQPSAGFAPEAPPATFADRFNALPGAPAPFAPAGRSFDTATFDPSTYAPNQAAPIAVGGYQMPRAGDAGLYSTAQASIPPNAQPTQGGPLPQVPSTDISAQSRPQQQDQSLPPAFGTPGEGNFTAGLRSLGNPGGLINKIADAVQGFSTGQRSDAAGIQQQNLRAQFQATRNVLRQSGLSDQEATSKAMLAVLNPEAAKTILPEALTSKQEFKLVKDALGGEHGIWVDKLNQTVKSAEAEGGGGPVGSSGGFSVLAPGVKQYNPSLSGDDYMAQFSPEVQNAAKAYMRGDVQPSGNPRNQGIETLAKKVAQKYGADMGIPVSDALYAEKRKYRTELGTNSPNSAGGQAKAFNQGIDHLSHLADNLEKLDNSNGMGIPVVAGVVNSVRQGVSNEQSAISDEAKSLGQTVAGEVGKLFSGSAGGGVHERELTRDRFDTVKSKPQLAAALRATIETMQGGLHALEQRRDSILGPNSGVELVDQTTREKIAKIQGVIDRLEGKASAAPSGGVQEGATATNPQTGQKLTFRNGKWQ
jgi:hypothetical protein